MTTTFLKATAASAALAMGTGGVGTASLRPMTIDDEMKLRAIVDVRISPDGARVAYVASTPVLPKNEHEGALFVVPATGGAPRALGSSVRIFNTPVPRPQLRWSPDGTEVSLVGFDAGGRPQVFAIPVAGGDPRALTSAPEGVFGYEWSPDGTRIAYLTRDPMPSDEARRRQDRSFVIRADAPDRPARLVVQRVSDTAGGRTAEMLTPPTHYVDALSWAPDGREIAYSAAPRSGFSAPYRSEEHTSEVQSLR